MSARIISAVATPASCSRRINVAFGETALLGALALQAGRTQVALHIYEEVNFGTSNVTALVYVMQGVWAFAVAMFFLFMLSLIMLAVVDATILHEADLSYLFTMQSFTSKLAKVLIGTFFGCWGSVVSLLLRLPDLEILKGEVSHLSQEFRGNTAHHWRNFCVRPRGAHFSQHYQH
jgi:hypothetical protein